VKELHKWNLSPKEAIEEQKKLVELLERSSIKKVDLVAGVDLSFPKGDQGCAVIVVLNFPTLKIVDCVTEVSNISFPYIPGLLAFREGPVFLRAWEKLKIRPDVVMFDGQGIAHPRRIGIAAHMGLFINLPTIGVAKSHLYGTYKQPGKHKGEYEFIYDESEIIGAVIRTKNNCKPVFVSPGHKCDVQSAIELVLSCCVGYRLPEPTRIAHLISQKQRVKEKGFSS